MGGVAAGRGGWRGRTRGALLAVLLMATVLAPSVSSVQAAVSFSSICPLVGAGGLIAGTDPADGLATSATLSYPYGLAISPVDGTLYFSERNWDNDPYSPAGRGRVRKITPGGQISQVALGPPNNTRLGRLAISNDGNTLYVAAVQSPPAVHQVFSVDLTAPTPTLTLLLTTANDVQDLEVSPTTGLLYISTDDNIVLERQGDGTVRTVAGGGVDGSNGVPANTAVLTGPISIAFDPSGVMTLGIFRRIKQVTPAATTNPYGDGLINTVASNGGTIGIAGNGGPATAASVGDVVDVAVNPAGEIFVGGRDSHTIRRISGGTIDAIAGPGTPASNAGIAGFADGTGDIARFSQTTEMVFHNGALYVVDARNNRIRLILPAATAAATTVQTVAGNGPDMVAPTGVALSTQTGSTNGVAAAPDGSVYIGDRDGHRVWRRASDGSMSVVAGTGQYRAQTATVADGVATDTPLSEIKDIAYNPTNGLLLILERTYLLAVSPSGNTISPLTGNASIGEGPDGVAAGNPMDTGAQASLTTDANGNAYMTAASGNIRRVSEGFITTLTNVPNAVGLAADPSGNLFIGSGSTDQRILYRDALTEAVSTIVGDGTRGNGDGPATGGAQVYDPNDLVYAPGSGPGELYFTHATGRVRTLVPGAGTGAARFAAGSVITVAGSDNGAPFSPGNWGDGADLTGNPSAARLSSPIELALDSTGHLVVGDDRFSVNSSSNSGPQQIRLITDKGCSEPLIGLPGGPVGTATSNGVDLQSLALEQVPFDASTIAATPLRSVPLRSSEIQSNPLRSSPLRSVPLRSVPLRSVDLASAPLRSSPLRSSTLSALVLDATTYPGGWTQRLVGTPHEGEPPESVRLADLLDDPTTDNVDETSTALTADPPITLADIDLSTSPLRSVSIASIALGSTPLRSVPLRSSLIGAGVTDAQRFEAWCDLLRTPHLDPETPDLPEITSLGYTCESLGLTPSSPLLALDVQSVPLRSVPLRSVPLRSVDLASSPLRSVPLRSSGIADTPLRSSPLRSVPLRSVATASAPLRSVPLRSVDLTTTPLRSSPLRSVSLSDLSAANLANVVNCTAQTSPPCSTATLGDAFDDGNLLPGATLGDLLEGLGPEPYDPATGFELGDLRFNSEVFAGVDKDGQPGITTADEVDLGDIIPFLPETPFFSLADALVGLIPAPDLPWEDIDLEKVGIGSIPGAGQVASSYVQLRVFPTQTDPVPVTVTLPAGWRYAETTDLQSDPDGADGSAVAPSTPTPTLSTDPGTGVQTMTYSVPPQDPLGRPGPRTLTLSFQVFPGDRIGSSFTLDATIGAVLPGGAAGVVQSGPIQVVDLGEQGTTGNSFADPRGILPDRLYFGYLNAPGDTDYYRVGATGAGAITTVHLSHLPADADLVVYELDNSRFDFRSNVTRLRQQNQPVAMADPQAGVIGDPLEPQRLADVPIVPGQRVAAVAAKRGTANESTELIFGGDGDNSPGDDDVTYVIAVSSYGGATSPDPYVLRVQQMTPPGATACSAADVQLPALGGGFVPSTPVASLPAGTESLVLVNRERMAREYGVGAATQLDTDLATFAADPNVKGVVVPVDAVTDVRDAYTSWDQSPCGLGRPNVVVREINDVVDQLLAASPAASVQNIVIVGGDEQIPMARLIDNTKLSNELEYGADLRRPAPGGTFVSTPQTVALSSRSLLSDDPYASLAPKVFGPDVVYPPDLAVGRLVESPTEISGQLSEFTDNDTPGRLDPDTALVTGYDFLTDGAEGVRDALAGTATVDSSLINNTWTADDLRPLLLPAGAAPDIASLNAHFDHHQLLPAKGDTDPNAELFTTADLDDAPGKLAGRILFSMGCHSGVSAPDFYLGHTSGDARDWAQVVAAQRAVWVANTGFGYGDTAASAYSERLMTMFATHLGDGQRAGEALRLAKQEYLGGGLSNSYDAKAMSQIVFYGLPMYRVGSGTPTPPAPTYVTPTPDPAAGGLSSYTTTVDTGAGLEQATSPDGSGYFLYRDPAEANPLLAEKTSVVDGRPIQPRVDIDVTAAGMGARGAVVTALAMQPTATPLTVSVARPVVDQSEQEPTIPATEMVYPSTFGNVTTYDDAGGQRNNLVLIPGQWSPDSNPATRPNVGSQRLFTSMTATVYYAPNDANPLDDDLVAPTVSATSATATTATGGVTFTATVTDDDGTAPVASNVRRVVVLYLDGSTWRSTELAETTPGSGRFTGGGPATAAEVDYLVQAVDASGNVGVSSNKAHFFTSAVAPPPQPGVNGAPQVDGGGDLTATAFQPVPLSGSFTDADSTAWSGVVNNGDGGVAPLTVTGTTFTGSIPAYTAAGTYTATVSICDDLGVCGADTVTVTVSGSDVSPTASCTLLSFGTAVTWWGTQSGATGPTTLPIGPTNRFLPAPADRGQPALIEPGAVPKRFATQGPASIRLGWSLGGNTAEALGARGCAS